MNATADEFTSENVRDHMGTIVGKTMLTDDGEVRMIPLHAMSERHTIGDELYPPEPIDPRDARLAELEAKLEALAGGGKDEKAADPEAELEAARARIAELEAAQADHEPEAATAAHE